jgi:hypothetical protein
MKATVKRGSKKRLKSAAEAKRDVGKTAKAGRKRVSYPIAETLRWVADGEKLLVKWGAIKSPGAKRIAGTVGKILSVLEALTELRV